MALVAETTIEVEHNSTLHLPLLHPNCPLSPMLFVIATRPFSVILSQLTTNDDIVVLHLPYGGQLVMQALAYDSFMFLQA